MKIFSAMLEKASNCSGTSEMGYENFMKYLEIMTSPERNFSKLKTSFYGYLF